MTYRTIFEVTEAGTGVGAILPIMLLLTLVGGAMVWDARRRTVERFHRIFAYGWFFFAVLLTVFTTAFVVYNHVSLTSVLREGRFKVAEGAVENFHPMPPDGKGEETFTVDGVPFAYSDYRETGTYNTTVAGGGEIRPGRVVRLSYFESSRLKENLILKVEVAADPR